jgi:hypothetical protein
LVRARRTRYPVYVPDGIKSVFKLPHPAAEGSPGVGGNGQATGELTRDEVLDNITLYWLTKTRVSASRLYWEYKGGFLNAKGVSIPVAVSVPSEQY